jgi:hypothetical protein
MTTTEQRDSVRVYALCCLIRRADGSVDEVIGALAGFQEREARGVASVTPEYARRMLATDEKRDEQTLYYGVCEVDLFEPTPESPRLEIASLREPFGRAPLDVLAHNLDKIPAPWREFTLRRIETSN